MGSDSNGSARARWWERWAPASGAVSVILLAIAFLVAGSSPDPGDPATEIASYLASDSNQNQNFAAFFVFLAGVLFMLVFFSVLRSRLAAAEGPGGGLAPLAFGSGVASAALWIGAVSFFVAPLAAADNRGDALGAPADLYAFSSDAGYFLWVGRGRPGRAGGLGHIGGRIQDGPAAALVRVGRGSGGRDLPVCDLLRPGVRLLGLDLGRLDPAPAPA